MGRPIKYTHSSTTSEYKTWNAMKHRCKNEKLKSWDNYGGRGIEICERWESFDNFFADMGKKPSPNHSIDRIDVDGNYEPDNCRWATRREQSLNRRINPRNKSGTSGVYWLASNKKWRAQIWNKGEVIELGSFMNLEEAVIARKEAELKYHV